jgi:hypothetical protein
MDNNAKSQAIEQIKKAQNVLVTVSDNPSVDQLSASIGFTLLLNKLNKHATAVFSGQVPSTIEFLKPEETLETNTDSLRDFIISLDKNKADKLRYKVEDDVVKIYITPYRTSISDKDLVFDQGDFNVDVIIALGVHSQGQLDKAIQNHGRILHTATIISIVMGDEPSEIGGINWLDKNASSLCEMLMSISESLKPGLLDEQIATALLTGIVSETERFSNQKTTPKAMTMSAQLMSAGANQQLIAEALDKEEPAVDTSKEQQALDSDSLGDIQLDQPIKSDEEAGVLKLHHNKDDIRPPESKNLDQHPALDSLENYPKQLVANDLNSPESLRNAVNEVQKNKNNFDDKADNGIDANDDLFDLPSPEIKATNEGFAINQLNSYEQSDIDKSNIGRGSFKGKNINPPADINAPKPIQSEAFNLPSIDGSVSYNQSTAKVVSAPSSALESIGSQSNYANDFNKPEFDKLHDIENPAETSVYKEVHGAIKSKPPINKFNNTKPISDYQQGPAYIDPANLPKEHDEDLLTEDEAKTTIASKKAEFDKIPEIKLEKSKIGYLDHAPTTIPEGSNGDNGIDDDEELPSIERGKPKFSKYLGDPPKDNPKLNSLEGVIPDQTINPFTDSTVNGEVPKPQEIQSTQDPLLATQHDAESASAREVPETRSPRLYDDGVGVANKPLGAPVGDNDTLDQIEHNVEQTVGAVHGHKVNDARKAVNDAFEELDLNSLYLGLDSDPAVKQGDNNVNNDQNDEAPPPLPPPIMPPGLPN